MLQNAQKIIPKSKFFSVLLTECRVLKILNKKYAIGTVSQNRTSRYKKLADSCGRQLNLISNSAFNFARGRVQYLLYLTGEIEYRSQKSWHSISCTLETKITKGAAYTASVLNTTHPQGLLVSKTQEWFFFNTGIIWM